MKNSAINMICDSYVSLDDAMLQNYIASNYVFPVVNMEIMDKYYTEFVDNIKKLYGDNIRVDEIIISSTNKTTFIEDKEVFFVEMSYNHRSKTWSINIYATAYVEIIKIIDYVKKYEPAGLGIVIEIDSYYIENNGQLTYRKDFKEKKDIIDVSPLYYPYLNTDILFKKYAYSNESILMILGDAGLGKTKLVALLQRYMFDHPEFFSNIADDDETTDAEITFKIAYVKNEEILAKDTFWEDLNTNQYNIIFLDDADECLTPRDEEIHTLEDINRKKFMSQLLSFTDGINSNDTKVIITTNRPANMIDKAALRRGRTFDILKLKPLTRNQALDIWNYHNLDVSLFDTIFKNDIILQSELGAEIQMLLKLRETDENVFGEYLLSDDISLIHTYRKKDNVIKI